MGWQRQSSKFSCPEGRKTDAWALIWKRWFLPLCPMDSFICPCTSMTHSRRKSKFLLGLNNFLQLQLHYPCRIENKYSDVGCLAAEFLHSDLFPRSHHAFDYTQRWNACQITPVEREIMSSDLDDEMPAYNSDRTRTAQIGGFQLCRQTSDRTYESDLRESWTTVWCQWLLGSPITYVSTSIMLKGS